MAQRKKGIVAVTGMIMVVLAIALMVPAITVALESPQEDTIDMIEGERVVLTGSITVEAVTVEKDPNGFVNISIVNEQTGSVAFSGNLETGDTDTVTIDGQNVTIEILDIVSTTEVVVQFTYPTYIGFPANAQVLFENITLFLIVSTMLLIGGVLVTVVEVID